MEVGVFTSGGFLNVVFLARKVVNGVEAEVAVAVEKAVVFGEASSAAAYGCAVGSVGEAIGVNTAATSDSDTLGFGVGSRVGGDE